ncbi:MAG TPA: PBP1A family penicillin-binding protein [Longimicrobiales bacterium]|nr:PBP1A family penicillin-binding protein [Longimicrobiales bacterium]
MAETRRWTAPFRWLGARPRLLTSLIIAVLVAGAGAAGLVIGVWQNVCYDCPSIAQIYAWEPKQSTQIFAHDGRLIAELFQERRTPIDLDDLPEHVPQAFIAVEDKRFYEHGAFDPIGYARAVRNVLLGRAGGGSTITLQLARNMFVEEIGFDQSFTRKLKELKVAIELERVYSKDEILQAYLNQINFGHGWYGIETAAQRYFGKSASELNPAEGAMLAAVINLPGRYSPFRHPEAARARRNLVLRLMEDQDILEEEEAERWMREPLPEAAVGADEADLAPYFVEWVREQMDDRYGADLYRSGLRIYTTLDIDMQRRAQTAMEAGWRNIEATPGYRYPTYASTLEADATGLTRYIQGMMIVVEPATGEVRALIGGRDFEDSKFNRATQALRQPGSVFKPFVFQAAISSGIPASHVIIDSPIMMEQADGSTWSPRNYTGDFRGAMNLREALKLSINVVTVKLALEVGLETVAQYAQRMGIATPIPRVPAVAIGAAEVIPLQVAGAYGVWANRGAHVEPRPILRVEDSRGRVLWQSAAERQEVLDSLSTWLVTDLMREVVDHGSAYSIRDPERGAVPYSLAAAGKTGTTNDATDVWFVGFTPDLLAAVWFGFDQPREITPGAAGGAFAAPVWAEFMNSVYFGEDAVRPVPEPWARPAELTARLVDEQSGRLATDWCPTESLYTESYIPGTEPAEFCDLHGPGIHGLPRLRQPVTDTLADSLSAADVPVSPQDSARVPVNPRFRF